MSSQKKTIRRAFRTSVFERDGYRCVLCGLKGQDRQEVDNDLPVLDAHHITDRHDMPNGGYVPENGVSLCPDCHILAEDGSIGAEVLYEKIGSSYEKAVRASEKLHN